ncbi:MAG TPA: flagellar hook-basal body complex protein FliE [Hungateiclostridium thermocellum]|jgi:flagellar hook-basal body complex protein FliE|uniref:Flagellar hook-basal body complex protein FliE n=2 Tax=Acetivibrio thermocellus TaxID=1515 RepID=A3DCM3_ACET2|nr:flagellar hook-basal body complex protein FliE [Acetivibrio thermocellus]CDG35178.1 flagellar hook-basal body complex subunit FliE [Acetivibrio thermocellus BC1]ABN51702.1 flagellar hook-basal body complex subunit FliE [Acetivibrio thermocellus ATCC 27405]ADU74813.1 flagellar hook-basal body complex subunit FliE [Acetivibrio thermocellus DSM 1313]ALX08766.1 Flagellar hook-basal body complex protein fliE [Acetivibrio thermocellus AD2]ANV76517.1 Flagellar hook-basal body complex protein fliE 
MAVNGINLVTPSVSGIDFTVGNTISNKNENVVQSFSDYLKNAIKQVDELEKQSKAVAEDFAAGKTDNIHEVMIAAQKADIAIQFTLQIRNKILDAYNEIMRMQI